MGTADGVDDAEDDFIRFVERRQAQLVRLGWGLTGDRQLGEDLTQVALQQVWRHWSRVSQSGEPFAYTQRILVNLWSSRRRSTRWRSERVVDEIVGDARVGERSGDVAEGVVGRAEIDWWLGQLPPRQRAVIVLRVLLDCSVSDTADRLRCSQGTVKSQTAKALRTLRQVSERDRREERERSP